MKKSNNNLGTRNKKQILMIVLTLLLLLGGTYAWLQITLNATKTTRLEAGTLQLKITNEENAIDINDALPMTDVDGLLTEPYTFSLTNTGSIESEYTIYLDDEAIPTEDTAMDDDVIKFSLTNDYNLNKMDLVSGITDESGRRILDTGVIQPNATYHYRLNLWIKGNATSTDIHVVDQKNNEVTGKVFSTRLRIEASQKRK